MTIDYILDTNVLIYLFQEKPRIGRFLQGLNREWFFISVVTYFEFLTGAKGEKEEKEVERRLKQLVPLDIRLETVKLAHTMQKNHPMKLKFKDLMIAATAQLEGLTLITADKDFKKIKGLNLRYVQT